MDPKREVQVFEKMGLITKHKVTETTQNCSFSSWYYSYYITEVSGIFTTADEGATISTTDIILQCAKDADIMSTHTPNFIFNKGLGSSMATATSF